MIYALGIVIMLLSKVVIGIANVLDGKLSRKTFSSVWSIVVINGLLIIPILPILYLILHPKPLSKEEFYIITVVAAIEVFYQMPYYIALRKTDTSVVMSLFNLEKIFIPVLAYLIVRERLSITQYIGFGIIISCSLFTTISRNVFKPNKAIYYMLFVSLILAVDSVLQKYALEQVDWKSLYFWLMTLSVPFYFLLLIIQPSARKEVFEFISAPFRKNYMPLYQQNIATWIAGGMETLALSLLPVTIAKAVGSFHAVIVHLIASKGHKGLDLDKREYLSFKRIMLFIFIAIGVIMVVVK